MIPLLFQHRAGGSKENSQGCNPWKIGCPVDAPNGRALKGREKASLI